MRSEILHTSQNPSSVQRRPFRFSNSIIGLSLVTFAIGICMYSGIVFFFFFFFKLKFSTFNSFRFFLKKKERKREKELGGAIIIGYFLTLHTVTYVFGIIVFSVDTYSMYAVKQDKFEDVEKKLTEAREKEKLVGK
ncbi:hypothetical protein HMI55_004000 [Coelomomyces lativittatus]|nr:hypothetical protein HMI55_004000 [Coelomomyces lativittatus]